MLPSKCLVIGFFSLSLCALIAFDALGFWPAEDLVSNETSNIGCLFSVPFSMSNETIVHTSSNLIHDRKVPSTNALVGNTKNSTNLPTVATNKMAAKINATAPRKSEPRILVWILTGPRSHMSKAIHVKRTWGAHFDKLLFMSSEEDARLGTIALPGVQEGIHKLWPKTQKAFQYVWQHHREDADWFMKADDDTFVVNHNLRDFLRKHDPNKPHYFGSPRKYHGVRHRVNYGGSGYILSKAALKLFIKALRRGKGCHTEIRKIYKGDEDTELGLCMASVNVRAKEILDARRRQQLIQVHEINNFDNIIMNFNGSWPKNYKMLSNKVVSFHRVTPLRMYALENLAHALKLF